MTDFNEYEAFAVTLGEAMQELAVEAMAKRDASIGADNESFQDGYLSAFHRVITLIQQQADLFDIPLERLSLDGIKETDLI